jgi:hypothetical protein
MKLKDVYIIFEDNVVEVVPKSKGKPRKAHVTDPLDCDLSNLALFFLEEFTNLTAGESIFKANPRQVYEEFCKIDEYNDLDEEALGMYLPGRKRMAELAAEEERAKRKRKAA